MNLTPYKGLSNQESDILDQINARLVRGFDRLEKEVRGAAKLFLDLSDETRANLKRGRGKGAMLAQSLERIALAELHPNLVLAGGNAARYLGRLPMEIQERHLTDGFEVVLPDGDVRVLKFDELDRDATAQVFEIVRGRVESVRDVAAQKAYQKVLRADREAQRRREQEADQIFRSGKYKVVKKGKSPKFFPDASRVESGLNSRDLIQALKDMGFEVSARKE